MSSYILAKHSTGINFFQSFQIYALKDKVVNTEQLEEKAKLILVLNVYLFQDVLGARIL